MFSNSLIPFWRTPILLFILKLTESVAAFFPKSLGNSSINHFNPCGDPGWCLLKNSCFIKERGGSPVITTSQCYDSSTTSVKAVEGDTSSIMIDILPCRLNSSEIKKGIFVFKEPFSLRNIGHVLGDDIWVIFSRLYFMNLHNSLDNIHLLIYESNKQKFIKKSIITEHYNLLTDNNIEYFTNIDIQNTKNMDSKTYCYEKLIVGWNKLSYSYNNDMISLPQVEAFRNRALAYAGITDQINAPICDVLFILKDNLSAEHKYHIFNVDNLVNGLRKYTKCNIKTIVWSGMTLKDQIREIANKRIVVSLPGSDIMNCIFQPIHSGIIVPYRCNDDICEGSNEIRLWYAKIPYRRLLQRKPSNNLKWSKYSLQWQLKDFISSIMNMADMLSEDVPHIPYYK